MGRKIVFCNCGGGRIKPERLQTIEKKLFDTNNDLIKISDLCSVSVLNKEKLRNILMGNEETLLVACHSRTLKLLLENAGIETGTYSCRFIDFLESDDEEILRDAQAFSNGNNVVRESTVEEILAPSDWVPWFPVIDYTRCSACGQCADFCLFGVYEKTEEKINVINPQECKNNCPACARICPQTAIIFPKYKPGGAIGGSDFIDEISEQKRQVEDINTILNGDIYSALEQRRKKRRSIILEEAMNKAIEERQNALNNNPENK